MDLDTLQRKAGGMLIIALRRANGTLIESPARTLICEPGDHVVAMAQPKNLPPDFLTPPPANRRIYRGAEVA
jgi:Trk K+ transport system NAD-binding subunit